MEAMVLPEAECGELHNQPMLIGLRVIAIYWSARWSTQIIVVAASFRGTRLLVPKSCQSYLPARTLR